MHEALIYAGIALTAIWGIAHLFATKGGVAGFGDISSGNRLILMMAWIVEGVSLLSVASFVLAAVLVKPSSHVSSAVYGVAVGTLLVLAVVSALTGAKVRFLPFRLCPVVFTVSAALIAAGAWL